MLDIEYADIIAFIEDCNMCGYIAKQLLDNGDYVIMSNGSIMAREYIDWRVDQGQEQYIGL